MSKGLAIAIPLFDGITVLDAIGPYEVLHRLPGAKVLFVGDKAGQTVFPARSKLGLVTTNTFDEVPEPSIIVLPGGPPPRLPLRHMPLIDWIRKAHGTSLYTTSVCTGSLFLGEAGLLNGVRATTHWGCFDRLASYGAKPVSKRYVEEGKIITCAGVSAGIDMALYLVSLITDTETAKAIQLLIEYDPDPPFDCGSIDKATPSVLAKIKELRGSPVP